MREWAAHEGGCAGRMLRGCEEEGDDSAREPGCQGGERNGA